MFSLIITIISIALVAALALATLYFGGDAFNQGSARAAAATVVNQASQISGANTLYYLDNNEYATAMSELTPEYLASEPNPGNAATGSWDPARSASNGTVTITGLSLAVCEAVNVQAGYTIGDEGTAPTLVADLDDAVAAVTDTQFGCVPVGTEGSEVLTFVFK